MSEERRFAVQVRTRTDKRGHWVTMRTWSMRGNACDDAQRMAVGVAATVPAWSYHRQARDRARVFGSDARPLLWVRVVEVAV